MRMLVVLAATFALSACASIHEGNLAETSSGKGNSQLLVSGVEIDAQADVPFALLAVTFENKGNDWIRIHRIDVLIDDEAAKTVSVVIGQDLSDWAQAEQAKENLERYNREMVRLGLVGLGAVAAGVGVHNHDPNLTAAGAGIMTGAAVSGVVDEISMKRGRATNPDFVPEQHLYRPFSVPGRLFVRKWILFNKKATQYINSIPVEIVYVDGSKEVRNVVISRSIR